MSVFLSPVGGAAAQFFDNNGVPLTGGKLFTYAGGTTTPQASYTTIVGNVAHTNPIILDSAGRVPSGEIWLTDQSYKFVLNDADNVLIATYDNIFAIPPVSALNAATTPLTGSEILSIVQSGTTSKVSVANLTAGRAIDAASANITNSVGIATSTPTLPLNIGNSTLPAGVTIGGQMISSDVAAVTPLLSLRRSAVSGNPIFAQFTSSGTAASPTAIAINRSLGRNDWWGFDGTNYLNAAAITVAADGAVSAGVVPGRFVFSTATTNTPVERMRITSSGDVGIGTATPSAPLHVEGVFNSFNANGNGVLLGTDASYSVIRLNQTTGGLIYFSESGANPKGVIQYVNSTNKMSFSTSTFEQMSINQTDGILLKRSTPVAGTGSSVSVSYAPNSVHGITLQAVSTVFTNNAIRFLNISDGVSGTITQTASTVAYNTSSDYRLKENIAPMTGALAKVAALKPVTYTWKIDGVAGQGFIAHELQEVIPDCVAGTKDAVDENGNVLPQGVDTSFLVATLTAAIQEQQAMIVQLQADVAALKSTN